MPQAEKHVATHSLGLTSKAGREAHTEVDGATKAGEEVGLVGAVDGTADTGPMHHGATESDGPDVYSCIYVPVFVLFGFEDSICKCLFKGFNTKAR
ncbi:hypothetical protein OESDEN_04200 [Oesophagostomum dentatum]|uniref:Uncharacterized protein n=1 Tax=Oesophagostomum dentatum TaxID=61180 RepID=A0A0B1TKA0_OESDE|nr:hypothetical protein OESDEN_04200 [Oesophagostomum dentatum]